MNASLDNRILMLAPKTKHRNACNPTASRVEPAAYLSGRLSCAKEDPATLEWAYWKSRFRGLCQLAVFDPTSLLEIVPKNFPP